MKSDTSFILTYYLLLITFHLLRIEIYFNLRVRDREIDAGADASELRRMDVDGGARE